MSTEAPGGLSDPIRIVQANLDNPEHQKAVLQLIDAYAQDVMGNGKPLADPVRNRLVPALRKHPTTVIFLAFKGERPVGIAVCFLGFSTFAACPVLNIHDLAVLPGHRRAGVGRLLLAAVEQNARATGCCKLTLEVQENNARARTVYEAAGFASGAPQAEAGACHFLSKTLH
jgi:GNAT superfamily N-acetyltransferase